MKIFCLSIALIFLSACGVKNDPVAPETPDEIGHGKPLYKSHSQDMEMDNKKDKADEEE